MPEQGIIKVKIPLNPPFPKGEYFSFLFLLSSQIYTNQEMAIDFHRI